MASFSKNFTEGAFGLDLCKPPLFPELSLDLALGFPDINLARVGRPRSRCPWVDLVANYGDTYQSLSNLDVSKNINASFSTGGNDFSFGIGAHLGFFDKVAGAKNAGILSRLEGGGFKPVTDFISGNIETPSQLAKRNVEAQLIEAPRDAQNTSDQIKLNAAFTAGVQQMGLVAASTFTNVLISRLLDKVKALLKPDPSRSRHVLPDLENPFAAGLGATKPKELFASQYSDLLTPRVTRQEDADILGELSACPSDVRGRWHCSMDEAFALALRQGSLTVRQAIDQGFLNENWQLIPSTMLKDNQDPTCRSRAFCAANLRKLRLARIIPIGWELAAESSANQASCTRSKGCITLGDAIRKFDDCTSDGKLDKDHPYCHLVDPNWVLTAFPAQCLVKGFSNSLFPAGGGRMEECQDTSFCLERDRDGKCVGGFGYCMAEQTFWQFDAPKCEEQFASCRTFQPRGAAAKPVSYVRATLDYGSCNESNAGCMWYATKRLPDKADDASGWDNGYASTTDRVYFDTTMQKCDAKSDGCTSLRKVVPGKPALNLVQNGSFESTTGTATSPSVPDAWTNKSDDAWEYTAPTVVAGAAAVHGSQGLVLPEGDKLVQIVFGVRPLHTYTLSFSARRYINAPDGASVYVVPHDENGDTITKGSGDPAYFKSSGCSLGSMEPYVAGIAVASELEIGDEWTRFSCTFVTPKDTASLQLKVEGGTTDAKSPLIDAVQLEETEQPTEYVEGLSRALETVNIRIPPDELACTGESGERAACDAFARVCKQTEAGCQGYRSQNQPSLPEIPAVLSPRDICPAECVGYAEFRKQHSTFDLVHDLDPRLDDPEDDTIVPFVPSTANSCAVQDVGCERFTNLDAQALGGEAESGFSFLRSCEKPGPDSQTFYTWEGSDTTGYQLKTWSLKRDTTEPLPQPPKVIVKPGADGVLKDPIICNQTSYLTAFDPDCRQFYDPEGNVFYRFESQTVLSSDTCVQLRKDVSNTADCTKTGGTFLPAANQCLYLADQAKSNACDVENAGCREYIGTQGKVQEEILNEDFSSASSTAVKGANVTTFEQSDENILVGDKSQKIVVASGQSGSIFFPLSVEPGALYELTFWARSTDPARPTIAARTTDQTTSLASTQIEVEWRAYRIGPFTGTSGGVATTTQLFIGGFTKTTFLDKVRVSRVEDRVYAVKDSWNTPASCDRTPEGIPQPQAMLGCQTFVDRKGISVNARQFTRLCRDTAIGCTAFVNTRNNETSYRQSWTRNAIPSGNETTVREADRYDYYIDDQGKQCSAAQAGCRAFGLPQFNQDRLGLRSPSAANEGNTGEPFTTVYLKDDAAKYDEGLCSEKELFCESYTSVGGTDYFRAPADHACEYKKAIVIDAACNVPNTSGATFDGWFKVGTTCPCYPDRLVRGSEFGLRYAGDPGYNPWNGTSPASYTDDGKQPDGARAWAATCPDTQAECTEFRDVVDTSDQLHPLGRPYFVVKDQSLDSTSCAGQVDPARGCVLFRDMSDTRLLYNTEATGNEYKARAYQPVAPVNCDNEPNRPACTDATEKASDVNLIVKVKPDRACSEWLSCASGETVYDPSEGKYKGICSDLKLCNKAGEPEGAGIPYCSNYVDRAQATEFFKEDAVIDAGTYASRATGFGTKDYSGMTITDQFQIMDAELAPIASILAQDPQTRSRFKKDYRLAVPVPFPGSRVRAATDDEKKALTISSDLKDSLCVISQTGGTGFLTDTSNNVRKSGQCSSGNPCLCWVSMDQSQPPQLAGAGEPITSDNLNVVNLVTRFRQSAQPELDPVLARSFPNTQCKVSPQGDSPFGNEFVLEWDDTVNPPAPKRVAPGYAGVNLCEYGEDCSCVYKRINYGATTKFYEPLSTDVVNAVCAGGPRDGQPCITAQGIAGSQPPTPLNNPDPNAAQPYIDPQGQPTDDPTKAKQVRGGEAADQNALPGCGEGGTCMPIKTAVLARGAEGECLQEDLSRQVAGDRSRHECLIWNPAPSLSGTGDVYHWSPTAGFAPPQSSGRYYCSSSVRPPGRFNITPQFSSNGISEESVYDTWIELPPSTQQGLKPNTKGTYAGEIKYLWYTDVITSNGDCALCDGDAPGGSLDGRTSDGTTMGELCEQADDEQDAGEVLTDVMRLVTTGEGANRSYAEYAILFKPEDIARLVAGGSFPTDASGAFKDPEAILANSSEDSISSIDFWVPKGKQCCAYSEQFADVHVDDCDNEAGDINEEGEPTPDDEWHANFNRIIQEGGGKLERSTAQILTEDGTPNGVPVKLACSNDSTKECFVKTWQLDYRAKGHEKFQAFGPDIGRTSLNSISVSPVYGVCESGHWFSIRAVFEDRNEQENETPAEDITPQQLLGPFQLAGLWVTACSAGSDTHYIYMGMNISTADVCRELVETISKDSGDSTAFTDRNWSRGTFSMPKNGFTWNTGNIPYGASLATRAAGVEPLFMSGVSQSRSNPLHPPAFTHAGQTYYRPEAYPKSSWGILSNVFAKIYRIYGYSPLGVGRGDYACTDPMSPQFGQWCPKVDEISDTAKAEKLSKEYCGFQGTCVPSGSDPSNVFAQKVCNSFSGTNRGLDCSTDPDICHIAPMTEVNGILRPQYGDCERRVVPGTEVWEKRTDSKNWRCTGSGCPANECNTDKTKNGTDIGCSRALAIQSGAFRCSDSSVRGPNKVNDANGVYTSYCTSEKEDSPECPLEVAPLSVQCCAKGTTGCTDPEPDTLGACEGYPWAECTKDADCSFTARNAWPAGVANQTFNWTTSDYGGQYSDKFNRSAEGRAGQYYSGTPYLLDTIEGGYTEFDADCSKSCPFIEAFRPAVYDPRTRFFASRVRGGLQNDTPIKGGWDDLNLLKTFPGFVPLVFFQDGEKSLSYNFGSPSQSPTNGYPLKREILTGPPYYKWLWNEPVSEEAKSELAAHYAACEPLALMFRDGGEEKSTVGTCRGGPRAGSSCQSNGQCRDEANYQALQDDAADWCNPVTTEDPDFGVNPRSYACWPFTDPKNPTLGEVGGFNNAENSPKKEPRSELDNNICTHPPGYWPRPNYCKDPNDEYCGLFGYDINNKGASVNDAAPLPTDVTQGLYTPLYLNQNASQVGGSSIDYNYIDYYSPEPPQIAAPDARACQGSQCRVTALGTFSIDGLAEGIVNGGAGSHVATMRFYAWAAHNQMPLRRAVIDWGDGSQTELPDAHMKNRKPYCQTEKECQYAQGLTCDSDPDCPPGAGLCLAFGSCTNRPNVRCSNDRECGFGNEEGTCQPRTYFGNDNDACEEGFFEFRHAYACLSTQASSLTACPTTKSCSSNPNRSCESATDCAPGDRCVASMAPVANQQHPEYRGCFDQTSNTCRFTPRVLLVDNWGWCTGECRNALNKSGILIDDPAKDNYQILHPNGGCYDGTRVKSNVDFQTPIVGFNECGLMSPWSSKKDTARPWIVFPGSLQLLTGEAQ